MEDNWFEGVRSQEERSWNRSDIRDKWVSSRLEEERARQCCQITPKSRTVTTPEGSSTMQKIGLKMGTQEQEKREGRDEVRRI
jgi:hypothetical protein